MNRANDEDITIPFLETRLYGIRWSIMCFVGLVAILTRMIRTMFGIINNIYVDYFDISYIVTDWFSLIPIPSTIIFNLLIAVMIYDKTKIKNLAVTMATCLVFMSVCHLIAYTFPFLLCLIFVGQLRLGVAYALQDVVSVSCVHSWFPKHQIRIALVLGGAFGNRLGSLLGFVIPSNIFVSPLQVFNDTSSSEHAHWNSNTQWNSEANEANFDSTNRIRFIIFSSSVLVVTIMIFIFFLIFYKEKPPKPNKEN